MAEYKKPSKYYPTIPPTAPPTAAPTIPPTPPPTPAPTIPPTPLPTAPPCASQLFWIVEPGDTIFQIAQATGTSVTRIIQLNPHVNPNRLIPNTRICLP